MHSEKKTYDAPLVSRLQSLSSRDIKKTIVFFSSLAAFVLSKWGALLPGYSRDDFAQTIPIDLKWNFFTRGRYVAYLVREILSVFHLDAFQVFYFFTFTWFLCAAWYFAKVIEKITPEKTSLLIKVAAVCLIGTQPYYTAYFTYRQSAIGHTLMMAALIIHFEHTIRYMEKRNLVSAMIAALVVTLMALNNQLVFIYAALACLALWLSRRKNNRILFDAIDIRIFLPLVIASLLFIIILKIGPLLTGFALSGQAKIFTGIDLIKRGKDIGSLVFYLIFGDGILVPRSVKVLLFLGFAFPLTILMWRIRSAARLIGCWSLAAFGAIALTIFPVIIASKFWWPAARDLSPWGPALAYLLVIAYGFSDVKSKIGGYAVLTASIAMCAMSAQILFQQHRINEWDMQRAALIMHDIERQNHGLPPHHVTLVNPYWGYEIGLSTVYEDLNLSAFSTSWSAAGLLAESWGDQIDVSTDNSSNNAYCKGHSPWPAPSSITITSDNNAVVCLPQMTPSN